MANNLMTKTAFAAVMGCDKSQATRWAERGMPVEADGRVDAVKAAIWVRQSVDGTQRAHRSVGASQVSHGERRRWRERLVAAHLSSDENALITAAELLLPHLPTPTVRGIVGEMRRRLRESVVECLDEELSPPEGCKTWAEDPRLLRPCPQPTEWEDMLARRAAGTLAKVADGA